MFINNEHNYSVIEWIWCVGSCLLTFVTETFSLVYSPYIYIYTYIYVAKN